MELNYSFEKPTPVQIENHLKEFRDELIVKLDNNKVGMLAHKWCSLADFIICRDNAVGKVVGILVFYANTPPVIYTTHIWVSKTHRGLGICRELLRLAEWSVTGKGFMTHELEVSDINCIAKSAYDKLGFKIKEKRTESSIMSRNIDYIPPATHGKPSVAISCFTYNHEPYIRDALEGFVMQKTDFPFVAIVHDDASTDGTAAIIREYAEKYPDIIKPIYETENQYSKRDGSLERVMNKAIEETDAKYIAMCEGDDYWTDPLKLQKQVDFLESHPDYGMVYSDFNIKEEKTGRLYKSIFKTNPKLYPKTYPDAASFVLKKGYVAPPSWMYRKLLAPTDILGSLDGTFVYFTHFLATTKVHAFDEAMVTYRKLAESASHTSNPQKAYQREVNLLDTQIKLIDRYGFDEKLKEVCVEDYYHTSLLSAMYYRRDNDVRRAREVIMDKTLKERLLFLLYDLNPNIINPIRKVAHLIYNTLKYSGLIRGGRT